MHRCLAEPALWEARTVRLPPDEAHRLLHVLRLADGAAVVVGDGRGREADAVLRTDGGPRLELRASREPAAAAEVELVLFQALPKGRRMDLVVEKATELGAREIVPVVTQRTIKRPDAASGAHQVARWQKLAHEASRQCGARWEPRVRPVTPLAEALAEAARFDLFLVGSLAPGARPLREVLAGPARHGGVRHAGLLVGPEGDLAPDELAAACAAGARPVSFGALTLRVETAALFGLSVLSYELGSGPPGGADAP